MSLLDDLNAAQKKNSCKVADVLADLPDDEAKDLEQALASPTFYHTTISAVLGRRGYALSGHSIAKHRRGDCGCAK